MNQFDELASLIAWRVDVSFSAALSIIEKAAICIREALAYGDYTSASDLVAHELKLEPTYLRFFA